MSEVDIKDKILALVKALKDDNEESTAIATISLMQEFLLDINRIATAVSVIALALHKREN